MAIDGDNGTEYARQWVTSYEARILAYQHSPTGSGLRTTSLSLR
eukprot:COSAG06_NODE_54162_length_296_cov_0.736041_2_plen_43_part_01